MRRHWFCKAVQMGMDLRFTEILVAEFSARERVHLRDEPIVAALLSLGRSLMQTSRLFLLNGSETLEQ